MDFLIAAHTDVGIRKKTNQDSRIDKKWQIQIAVKFALPLSVMEWVDLERES